MTTQRFKIYTIALVFGGFTLYSCEDNKKQETENSEHVNQPGVDESKPHSHEETDENQPPTNDEKASGEGHSHSSPHGGIVVTADEYHIEMVMNGNEIKFYILDNAEKTMSVAEITGKAIFQLDGKTETKDLMVHEDYLMASLENSDKISTAIATFKINGKSVSAKFSSVSK